MTVLAGPFAAAAALLVLAGAPKVLRPGTTVLALRSVRAPASALLVRILGAVEVVIGLSALLYGGRLAAALVAASYLGFAGFVAYALARGGVLSSCGCFGKPDTPPTRLHIVLNLSAAAAAGAAMLNPLDGLADTVSGQPLLGLPFLVLSAATAWFAYLAMAALPTLRPHPSTPARRAHR